MSRAPDPVFRAWVDAARAYPIGDLAEVRGLRLRGRVERVGPCPDCGDGGKGMASDRFSINTHKGLFGCRRCGAGGDVVDLVQFLDHCDFLRACEVLTGHPAPRGEGHGLSDQELAQLERERAERLAAQAAKSAEFRERDRRRLFGMWRHAQAPHGTPVEAYLALRGLATPSGRTVRFDPAAKLFATGKPGAPPIHTGPAMYAAIVGPEGRFAGLHMTWIDLSARDGKVRVADAQTGEVEPAKKVRGSALGGRIELTCVERPTRLVIGEGIETTLSMHDDLREAGRDLSGTVFWTGIALNNIGGPHAETVPHPELKDRRNRPQRVPGPVPAGQGIPIPETVREIVLLRDGDSDAFHVEQTLQRAAARWAGPDRIVRVASPPAGMDFNDLRRASR